MYDLTDKLREYDRIIQDTDPERDSVVQHAFYRIALSILDGDEERFRQVLENAEELSPHKGWTQLPPTSGYHKGSYAIVLALNGNDIDNVREQNDLAQATTDETPFFKEIARLGVAFVSGKSE